MRLQDWIATVERGAFDHDWMPLTIDEGGHTLELQVSRKPATAAGVFESVDAHDMQQLGDYMGGWLLCTAMIAERRFGACQVKLLPIVSGMVKRGGTVANVTAAEHSAKAWEKLRELGEADTGASIGGLKKTWINDRGQFDPWAINFLWPVPAAETTFNGGVRTWLGVKVYPMWTVPGWFVVQPGGAIPDLARQWVDGKGLTFAQAKQRGADIVYGDAHGLVGQDDYSQGCGPYVHPLCKLNGKERATAGVLTDAKYAGCYSHEGKPMPDARLRGVKPYPAREGSTTIVISDTPPPDTLPAPASDVGSLWAAVVARATWDLENGVREDLGRNDGHRIREYIAIYNEQSKRGLGPPLNWCALGFNAWLTEACEQLGIDKPVEGSSGAQATMIQFKTLGLWVARKSLDASNLLPGNVVVWKRPPKTWTGHIGIIESYDPAKRVMHTIEANSGPMGDRVSRMERSIDDPRLFGVGILNDGTDEGVAEGTDVSVVELPAEVIAGTPEETWEGSDPVEGPDLIKDVNGDVRGIVGAPVADGKPVMPSALIGWLREVGVLPKKLGNVFGDAADAVADAVEEPPDGVS